MHFGSFLHTTDLDDRAFASCGSSHSPNNHVELRPAWAPFHAPYKENVEHTIDSGALVKDILSS